MSANNIAETSTSTGTGNFTLAGAIVDAANYVYGATFNSFYGTSHLFPYRIEDTAGNWELGEGYLSASTTLVRQNVFNNSLGTTAKINFPSGAKRVYVPTDARAFGARMLNTSVWQSPGPSVGIRAGVALTANRLYISPFIVQAPIKLSAIGVTVTNLAASSSARLGLYNLPKQVDGSPGYTSDLTLLADLGTIDVSSTGIKSISTTLKLGQGAYGFGIVSNGAPSVLCGTINLMDIGVSGNSYQNNPTCFWFADSAAYFTALPATTPGAMTVFMNVGAPQILIKGGIQ